MKDIREEARGNDNPGWGRQKGCRSKDILSTHRNIMNIVMQYDDGEEHTNTISSQTWAPKIEIVQDLMKCSWD